MIITEKQLIMLFEMGVFLARLNMSGTYWNSPYNKETMINLVNDIINQQSNKLMEIK